MIKQEAIRSLSSLRKRKKALKLEMEVAKRELAHNGGVMRTDLRSYLLKRVALPAAGVGLGVVVLVKALSAAAGGRRREEEQQEQQARQSYPARREVVHHYESDASLDSTRRRRGDNTATDIGRLIKQWWPVIQTVLGFAMGYMKKDAEQPDPPRRQTTRGSSSLFNTVLGGSRRFQK